MVSDAHIFYTYEHWRPDLNKCFYVGKGRGSRAWDMRNDRNPQHIKMTAYLAALGVRPEVRVIVKDISSQASFSCEKILIATHGIENLLNANKGGGGVVRHSPEALAKISATSKGRRTQLGRKRSEQTKALLRQAGFAGLETFRKYSHLGPKSLSRRVTCVDDGKIFDSANEAARFYGLKHGSSISEVCLEKKHRLTAAGKVFKYMDEPT